MPCQQTLELCIHPSSERWAAPSSTAMGMVACRAIRRGRVQGRGRMSKLSPASGIALTASCSPVCMCTPVSGPHHQSVSRQTARVRMQGSCQPEPLSGMLHWGSGLMRASGQPVTLSAHPSLSRLHCILPGFHTRAADDPTDTPAYAGILDTVMSVRAAALTSHRGSQRGRICCHRALTSPASWRTCGSRVGVSGPAQNHHVLGVLILVAN